MPGRERPPRDFDWQLVDPTNDDVAFLEERLYEFNVAATGIGDGRGIGVFVRDGAGRLVAAAAGYTWGGSCTLRQVWVDAPLRGRGIGRELVARAEAEARRRGCHQLLLATHSFQAPDFYRKLGFERITEVPDHPPGHSELVLRKRLAGGEGGGGAPRPQRRTPGEEPPPPALGRLAVAFHTVDGDGREAGWTRPGSGR